MLLRLLLDLLLLSASRSFSETYSDSFRLVCFGVALPFSVLSPALNSSFIFLAVRMSIIFVDAFVFFFFGRDSCPASRSGVLLLLRLLPVSVSVPLS